MTKGRAVLAVLCSLAFCFPRLALWLAAGVLVFLLGLWLLAPHWYFKAAHGWYWRPPPAVGQAAHDAAVRGVQDQVKAATSGDGARLCTNDRKWCESVTTRACDYKKSCQGIRLSLGDVVSVDTESDQPFVRVQPRIAQTQLTRHLVSMGWTLPMVIETEKITVGGLIMGAGIETTSHRVGLFRDICLRYELLLADGSIVTCSRDERPDLFEAVPFSYGCLCFLVSVDIAIIPAHRYVHLKYEAVTSGEDAVERIRDLSLEEDPEEFVEGLVHSATASTIITGNQCDAAPPGTRVYNQRFWSPYWHNHVRDCVRGGVAEEVMPLEQYYFRHDRGLFWVMEQATPVMNTWYIRLLFGWALNSRLFHFIPEHSPQPKKDSLDTVVQDVTLPIEACAQGVKELVDLFGIYPLWLCPLRNVRAAAEDSRIVKMDGDAVQRDLFIDIGVYGVPRAPSYFKDKVLAHKKMETLVLDTGGFLFSYAICFMNEAQLWQVYDKAAWDRAVEAFDADGSFPSLLDKLL